MSLPARIPISLESLGSYDSTYHIELLLYLLSIRRRQIPRFHLQLLSYSHCRDTGYLTSSRSRTLAHSSSDYAIRMSRSIGRNLVEIEAISYLPVCKT